MLIAMTASAVVCAATATAVALKPHLTHVVKLSLIGAPYIVHTTLAILSVFHHNDTDTHWTSLAGTIVSPLLVLAVLIFT